MTESAWSAGEPFEHTDRFTWERLIRDPKVGMPRETLCAALLLATYSTGTTGRDIEVSEKTLRDILGYGDERQVRRLLAELRDGYGVIIRDRRGNRYKASEHSLVIPNDLTERIGKVRDAREAEARRVSKAPKSRRYSGRTASGATERDQAGTGLYRTRTSSIQDAQRFYSGRSASHDQETKQLDQDGGPVSGASVEGTRAAAREASPEPIRVPAAPRRESDIERAARQAAESRRQRLEAGTAP